MLGIVHQVIGKFKSDGYITNEEAVKPFIWSGRKNEPKEPLTLTLSQWQEKGIVFKDSTPPEWPKDEKLNLLSYQGYTLLTSENFDVLLKFHHSLLFALRACYVSDDLKNKNT